MKSRRSMIEQQERDHEDFPMGSSSEDIVENLPSLLALPLDINDLKHILQVESRLRNDRKGDHEIDSTFSSTVPFEVSEQAHNQPTSLPECPTAELLGCPVLHEVETIPSSLPYLGLFVLVTVFIIRLALMRVWSKRRDTVPVSQPPRLIRTDSANGSDSKTGEWANDSFEKHEDPKPRGELDEDRILNLMDQNKLLQSVLEEQRARILRMDQELQDRNQSMFKMEAVHEQQMRDLSAQMLALSSTVQQDRVEHARHQLEQEQVPEWRDDIVRRLDVLSNLEQDHRDVKSEQQSLGTGVKDSLRAVEERLVALESKREEAHALNLEEMKRQFNDLAQQVPAMKRGLEERNMQITKLGQYVKSRDEQENTKVHNLAKQCEDLASKLCGLNERITCQEVKRCAMQEDANNKGKMVEAQITELQKELQAHEFLQREGQGTLENHRVTLEKAIGSLTSSYEQTNAAVDACKAVQSEVATDLQAVKIQCQYLEEQSSSAAATQDEFSRQVNNVVETHQQLQRDSRIQMNELASQVQELAASIRSQEINQGRILEPLQSQLSEVTKEQEDFHGRQQLYLKQFRAEVEDRLIQTEANIKSLARNLAEIQNETSANDQIAGLEHRHLPLIKKLEKAVEDMQDRMDYELVANHFRNDAQITNLQELLDSLKAEQKELIKTIDEVRSEGSLRSQTTGDEIEKTAQNLQESLDTVMNEIGILKSICFGQEKDISAAAQERRDIFCKVGDVQKAMQREEEAARQLISRVDALESSFDDVERHSERSRAESEQRCSVLATEIVRLAADIDNQRQLVVHHESKNACRASEIKKGLRLLADRVGELDSVQQEGVDSYSCRFDDLQGRLLELSTKLEKQETMLAELRRRDTQNLDLLPKKASSTLQELIIEDVPGISDDEEDIIEQANSNESCIDDTLHATRREESEPHKQQRSSTTDAFLSLSTKLVAFNVELERRDTAVVQLEQYTKEKSDDYLSRAEVLSNEIEEQRGQLKKWEELTNTTKSQKDELGDKLRQQGWETARLEDDMHAVLEDITEIEDTLRDNCISGGLKSRLQSRLDAQKERRNALSRTLEESKATVSSYTAEYSTLAAKQELFEDELNRRKTRLSTLRSSLTNVLELVAVEREALEQKLVLVREERENWKEKTSDLYQRLQSLSGRHSEFGDASLQESGDYEFQLGKKVEKVTEENGAKCPGSDGDTGQAFGEPRDNRADREPIGSLKRDVLSQIEALKIDLAKVEDRGEHSLVKTKLAFDAEIEKSREQELALSKKIERISEDLGARELLEAKVDVLQRELEKGGRQIVRFGDEQSRLATDLNARLDALQKDIQALAALQKVVPQNLDKDQGSMNQDDQLAILKEKIETLAANFSEYGDLVARAEALADSIQLCEGRLRLFEKEKQDVREDVSAMIDFFKSDLQALKQSFGENMMTKDAEFARLLSKVEGLTTASQDQESQIQNLENRMQGDEASHKPEVPSNEPHTIQPEHILQQMNEKYIDLAAKVDLLANEVLANGQRDRVMEKRVMSRDALYLSQMEAVRRDLESQQARYQDDMQLRVYTTMVNVFDALAKRQGVPSPFSAWSSANDSQTRALKGSDGKQSDEENDAKDIEGRLMLSKRARFQQGFRWRPRGYMGYSMTSGIIADNMYTVMMASQHAGTKPGGKDDTCS